MEAIHESKLEQPVRHVQAEYGEIPGLCLTRRLAQRLLGLDDMDYGCGAVCLWVQSTLSGVWDSWSQHASLSGQRVNHTRPPFYG